MSPMSTATVTPVQAPGGQLRPRRDPDWLVKQLPVQMASEDFFRRFVSIFQELGSTLLEDVDNIDHVIDLAVAPPEFVRWLGSWIDAGRIDGSLPEELQRRMVVGAARTLTWRGTATGLRGYLELLSGGPARVEDGGGIHRAGEAPADPSWVRLWVSSTGLLATAEFVALVRDEVPAHVRTELYVADDLVWSTEEERR